jgi:hypothetical protein
MIVGGAGAAPVRGGRPRRRRGRLHRLLLVAGFGLLIAAWVGGNAPGFGPDEPAHFVKEVGAGTGQWLGSPGRLAKPTFGGGPGREERIAWINQNSRVFRLPPGLDPGAAGFPCDLFRNLRSAACLHRPHTRPPAPRALSYVGTYEPYLYAVPGAVMARAHTARGALYAGRAITGGIVLMLLAVAVLAAWDGPAGPTSVVGVLLAVSPMVLYMGSVLGTNGIEVAAAAALFALVLRFGRPCGPPRWGWPAAGVVAAVLASSRPSGPAWVMLAAAVAAGFTGPPGLVRRIRAPWLRRVDPDAGARRRGAGVTAVSQPRSTPRSAPWPWVVPAGAGMLATAAWEAFVQPHPRIRLDLVVHGLRSLPSDARAWARQWVGVFGWASLPMPSFAYWMWGLCLLALVAAAAVVGTRRQRISLAGVLLGVATVMTALDVLVLQQTRFPVYGRYLLPVAVLVPLASGEILTRRAGRVPAAAGRAGPASVIVLAAAAHAVGLWASARRFAVGAGGPAWFFGRSQWHPPGGWIPWVALAAAGVACLLVLAVLTARAAPAGAGGDSSIARRASQAGDSGEGRVARRPMG